MRSRSKPTSLNKKEKPYLLFVPQNVHKSVVAGVSEHINFAELTAAELKGKLSKVLTNPSYKQRMSIRSKRMRDQPEKPLDRAVWWIEFVLRNPDSSHLRPPTIEMGFVQANSLDLYAILFTGFLVGIFVVAYLVRGLCKQNPRQQQKVKNN